MIIARRTPSPSYGTDPVAGSLRSALRASTAARAVREPARTDACRHRLHVDALYPSLRGRALRRPLAQRIRRALRAVAALLVETAPPLPRN